MVSKPSSRRRFAILLALAAAGSWISTAAAQTEKAPPARSQPRTAAAPPRGAAPQGKAAAPGQPTAPANLMPLAPFTLTEPEQQLLDQILLKWEQQSDKVKTFKCTFTRWEIDPTFGPEKNDYTISEAQGDIKYKAPDRGEYRVSQVTRWDAKKLGYVADDQGVERWICDGKAIYEFDSKNKQLKVRKLPLELQGKAISDGPLPFIFGAKAEQLKRRYWMRDVTPKADVGKRIWLDARPKFQQDAANFQRATVILNEGKFLPEALQIYPPGIVPVEGKPKAYTAYGFAAAQVNDPLAIVKGDFLPPMTPPFWHRVDVEDPAQQPDNPPPPAGESSQAKRAAGSSPRK